MYKKILVANDGSEHALKAVKKAMEIARATGAELWSISVEEHLPHYAATVGEVLEEKREQNGYFRNIYKGLIEEAKKEGIQLNVKITPGHEVETIVKYAKQENFDLLIIGFMGHSKILGTVMGSTANTIVRLSPCDILVVR